MRPSVRAVLGSLALIVLVAVPARGQWVPAGPTDATPSMFARNSRAVFAADGSRRVTVHRSTDDGRTWASASPTVAGAGTQPTITGLAAGDAQQGLLVRSSNATGTGFYRSTNDGTTWTRVATLPTTQSDYDGLVVTRSGAFATIGIEPSTFTRRLLVSTNGGTTWTRRDSVFRTSNEVIAIGDTLVRAYERTKRASNGAFYSEYGVAVSVDLGQSWAERALPNCASGCLNGVASSNDSRLVGYGGGRLFFGGFVSTTLGQTWTPHPGFNGQLFRYAVGDTRVLAATGSGTSGGFGLQADTTGAGAWRDVSTQAGLNERLRRSVYWTGRSFLVGVEFGGVVRSEDGVTWAPAGRFAAHHNADLAALAVHKGALVGAWSNTERIGRSSDRGRTWRTDHLRLPSLDDAAGFLSTDSVLYAAGQEGVYRTADLRTWTRTSPEPRNAKAFFRSGGRTYVAGTPGIYVRPSGGGTWTQVLAQNFNQADVGVAGDRVIVAGGNGSVRSARISLDGGATWPTTTGTVFQVGATSRAFVTAATGLAVFGGGTFQRSLDDGVSWHNLKPALADSLAPNLVDNRGDTLLVVGQTYLAASLDHGTTWRKVAHTGLPFTFSAGSATNAPTSLVVLDDTVYVAFAANGVWKRPLADLGIVTAAAPAARPGAAALAVGPNPARGAVAVTLTVGAAGPARVAVYDALGRTVAVLHDGPLAPGAHRLRWVDDAAPGLYVVRAETAAGPRTQTVTRVR